MQKITNLKINNIAKKLVQEIIDNKDIYNANIQELKNNATIIDMKNASLEGGRLFAEICMGGLGTINFSEFTINSHSLPSVNIYTNYPIIACMASQLAGWSVKLKKQIEIDGKIKKKIIFDSLGSGPARAKSKIERELFEEITYNDDSDCAIILFETSQQPNEEVMQMIADKCNVDTDKTFALYAPTASLTGSIQIAARIVETGIHKLYEIGFPIEIIQIGFGTTSIAPIAKNDKEAMGRTNDSIIAGGMVYYTVNIDKEKEKKIFNLIKKAPANKSSSYGKPFTEIFKDVNYNFYNIDPGLFAPAIFTITNLKTGNTITSGALNMDLLKNSYGIE
ncbi:MAG: methenyltetrahydromethanopterin cyclohydrolase [Candidatus Lokiarchaeota archaeon]|nr:methenyltetrahydromethanopterin cyclohydrolase [Candidatus Lokiarchaeota archaeon]